MERRSFLLAGVAAATPLIAGLAPRVALAQTYPTEQNKPAEERERVADGLERQGSRALAELMRRLVP